MSFSLSGVVRDDSCSIALLSPADLSTQLLTLGRTPWRRVMPADEARTSQAVSMEQSRTTEW
jgi:hypothetical protein